MITTDWGDVIAARNSRSDENCRILIAPGVVLRDTILHRNEPSRWVNIRIGAMDPTDRPTIRAVDVQTGEASEIISDRLLDNRELVLHDLNFEGPWDATTENGRIFFPFTCQKGSTYSGKFTSLYHRCDFDGFDSLQGCTATGAAQDTYNIFNEIDVTNWRNYGIFNGGDRPKSAVIGSALHQHIDALSGGLKNGMHNNHGPLRDSESQYLYVSVCDLFSRNGWSTGGAGHAGYNVTADQPAIRINTNGALDYFSYNDRVVCEGDIGLEEQNSNNIDVPGNHVFDTFLQILGPRATGSIVRYGGTTFRNALCLLTNVPWANGGALSHPFLFSNTDGAPDNDEGIEVYNFTLVDLRSDANANNGTLALYRGPNEVLGSGTDFVNLTVENNVIVQPNRTGVNRDDEPLDLVTPFAGVVTRHKGPRWGFESHEEDLATTISGSGGTLVLTYTQITDTRANRGGVLDGSPTSQAYWLEIEGIDVQHRVRINGSDSTTYHADRGDIAVAFNPTDITITNNSGEDWNAGDNLRLHLDRASLQEDFNPTFDGSGVAIPTATPLTGSDAIGSGDAGKYAYHDILLRERPAADRDRGARQG